MKDKEKQYKKEIEAMQYFANKNAVSILDIVNTCGMEKQIEEMAKIIMYCPCIDADSQALELYNAGYRKIPKDARVFIPTDEQYVMLSKEELSKRDYEFRQIGYDECLRDNPKKDKYIKTLERKIDQLNAKLDQSSKETAEKFLNMIYWKAVKHIKGKNKDECFIEISFEKLDELAKQIGVKIKE